MDVVHGEVALSDMAGSIGPVTAISGQVFANPLAPQHSQYTNTVHVP